MTVHNSASFLDAKVEKLCVRLATDYEVEENFELHDDVQAFLRNIALPRRRLVDHLYNRLLTAKTVLVDGQGQPVIIRDMSPIESDAVEYWVRDWIKVRAPNTLRRRPREAVRERIRLLITLLRLVFPKESTTWGRDPVKLGLASRTVDPDEDAF